MTMVCNNKLSVKLLAGIYINGCRLIALVETAQSNTLLLKDQYQRHSSTWHMFDKVVLKTKQKSQHYWHRDIGHEGGLGSCRGSFQDSHCCGKTVMRVMNVDTVQVPYSCHIAVFIQLPSCHDLTCTPHSYTKPLKSSYSQFHISKIRERRYNTFVTLHSIYEAFSKFSGYK